MSPLAPLESSLAQALTDGFDVLTGVLLGCALAAGLRFSQLRWSWALVPLAVVLAFPALLGGGGSPALLGGGSLTLSVALAAAAARGLALHRRDLRAGSRCTAATCAREQMSPGPRPRGWGRARRWSAVCGRSNGVVSPGAAG